MNMTLLTNGWAAEVAAAALAGAELTLLALAANALLRRRGHTAAEAAACALMLPLVFLSAVFQAAFLAGLPSAAVAVEILAAGLSLAVLRNSRRRRTALKETLRSAAVDHPLIVFGVGGVLGYLLLQALIVPPGSASWQELAPMAFLEGRGAFLSPLLPGEEYRLDPLTGSVNHSVLFHLLLRAGTDRGLGLFGFFAYLSIGFSTYSLSRRYAWPPTALIAALVVLSMPRLVVQAAGPGIELMAAASALLVIVSLYRLLEQPGPDDLLLLMLFLLFSISGRRMPLAFPMVLAVLSALLLYRRHGGRIWWRLIAGGRIRFMAAGVPAVLLSQLWVPLARMAAGRSPGAVEEAMAPNTAALWGAFANLVRYGLESIHLTLPVEQACRWLFGASPLALLEGVYRRGAAPFFDHAGAAAPFAIRWVPDETLSWFGPLGFFLVVPAVGYALWRGPRRIKAVALALAVYGYLAALIPAWEPGNARLFTVFFACGGFCVAFFLPPWRLTRTGKHLLETVTVGLMIYAGAMNADRPAFGYANWLASLYAGDKRVAAAPNLERTRHSIWKALARDRRRIAEGRDVFGDDRIQRLTGLLLPDRPVGVCVREPERAYPLLLRWSDRRVVLLSHSASAAVSRSMGLGYLLYLDLPPDAALPSEGMRRIWSSGGAGALPGALYELMADAPLRAKGPPPGPARS